MGRPCICCDKCANSIYIIAIYDESHPIYTNCTNGIYEEDLDQWEELIKARKPGDKQVIKLGLLVPKNSGTTAGVKCADLPYPSDTENEEILVTEIPPKDNRLTKKDIVDFFQSLRIHGEVFTPELLIFTLDNSGSITTNEYATVLAEAKIELKNLYSNLKILDDISDTGERWLRDAYSSIEKNICPYCPKPEIDCWLEYDEVYYDIKNAAEVIITMRINALDNFDQELIPDVEGNLDNDGNASGHFSNPLTLAYPVSPPADADWEVDITVKNNCGEKTCSLVQHALTATASITANHRTICGTKITNVLEPGYTWEHCSSQGGTVYLDWDVLVYDYQVTLPTGHKEWREEDISKYKYFVNGTEVSSTGVFRAGSIPNARWSISGVHTVPQCQSGGRHEIRVTKENEVVGLGSTRVVRDDNNPTVGYHYVPGPYGPERREPAWNLNVNSVIAEISLQDSMNDRSTGEEQNQNTGYWAKWDHNVRHSGYSSLNGTRIFPRVFSPPPIPTFGQPSEWSSVVYDPIYAMIGTYTIRSWGWSESSMTPYRSYDNTNTYNMWLTNFGGLKVAPGIISPNYNKGFGIYSVRSGSSLINGSSLWLPLNRLGMTEAFVNGFNGKIFTLGQAVISYGCL